MVGILAEKDYALTNEQPGTFRHFLSGNSLDNTLVALGHLIIIGVTFKCVDRCHVKISAA